MSRSTSLLNRSYLRSPACHDSSARLTRIFRRQPGKEGPVLRTRSYTRRSGHVDRNPCGGFAYRASVAEAHLDSVEGKALADKPDAFCDLCSRNQEECHEETENGHE